MWKSMCCGLLAVLAIAGCGGGGGGSSVAVSISPTVSVLPVGGTQTFVAAVAGPQNFGVQWAVVEAQGGTITSAGVYTAPNLPGNYHITATSLDDPTKIAAALVAVHIAVAINPPFVTTTLNKPTQFSAAVLGSANGAITWSVTEALGGSVTGAGAYTAPAAPGTFHVVATSQADTNQSATATVVVQSGSANGTIQ